MEFTYNAYAELIRLLKQQKYTLVNYKTAGSHEREVILRHDVDFSPNKALELAQFENKLLNRTKSTYFFLIRSEFYNILSPRVMGIIRSIYDLGHDIGLHFDETDFVLSNASAFTTQVNAEARLMERVLDIPIQTVSMHRPSPKTLDADYAFEGLVNSYSKVFFTNWKYISDSRMYWRENVMDVVSNGQYAKLHILTHPFWYAEDTETTRHKLYQFAKAGSLERYDIMSQNFRDLSEYLDRSECT